MRWFFCLALLAAQGSVWGARDPKCENELKRVVAAARLALSQAQTGDGYPTSRNLIQPFFEALEGIEFKPRMAMDLLNSNVAEFFVLKHYLLDNLLVEEPKRSSEMRIVLRQEISRQLTPLKRSETLSNPQLEYALLYLGRDGNQNDLAFIEWALPRVHGPTAHRAIAAYRAIARRCDVPSKYGIEDSPLAGEVIRRLSQGEGANPDAHRREFPSFELNTLDGSPHYTYFTPAELGELIVWCFEHDHYFAVNHILGIWAPPVELRAEALKEEFPDELTQVPIDPGMRRAMIRGAEKHLTQLLAATDPVPIEKRFTRAELQILAYYGGESALALLKKLQAASVLERVAGLTGGTSDYETELAMLWETSLLAGIAAASERLSP